MAQQFTRQTAYKVWVSDIHNAQLTKGEGEFEADYITVRDRKISRVNVIGVVVSVSDGEGYTHLIIDDGTGNVALRLWENNYVLDVKVGEVVLVIGRIKVFNDARSLSAEVVKKVEATWAKVRNFELKKLYGDPVKIEKFDVDDVEQGPPAEEEGVVEEESVNDVRGGVLSYIEENDVGTGVLLDDLTKSVGGNSEKVVQELLKDGEIFEVAMGRLRILP